MNLGRDNAVCKSLRRVGRELKLKFIQTELVNLPLPAWQSEPPRQHYKNSLGCEFLLRF